MKFCIASRAEECIEKLEDANEVLEKLKRGRNQKNRVALGS